MSKSLIDQIKKDRAEGTPEGWIIERKGGSWGLLEGRGSTTTCLWPAPLRKTGSKQR